MPRPLAEIARETRKAAAAPAPAAAAPAAPRAAARARGAGAHDAPAQAHRRAAEGGAEHRRHADHLQRGRHDRGHGAAQALQGQLREAARREARLHVLLREGLRSTRSRSSRRSMPRSTATTSSTRTTTTSASPSAPSRAWSCRWCATPIACASPRSRRRSPSSASAPATASSRIEELTGGTFTITNGGVYGSLMSTPILNPPQSGILGMHKIQAAAGGASATRSRSAR